MTAIHYISPEKLSLATIEDIINNDSKLELSEQSHELINSCRTYLDKKISDSGEPIYGINTGFGSLCNVSVSESNLGKLQENLVKSHACGMGEEVSIGISKLMILLKIHALSLGKSGVHISTVKQLIDFYNTGIIPVVYEQGSLGASGDLAPLAHMALALIGEGEVYYQGEKQKTAMVLETTGIKPIKLKAKEGLALLNGTQFMSAHLTESLLRAKKLIRITELVAATSIDAYDGRIDAFNENLHTIRPHKGQITTAKNIRKILQGSEILNKTKKSVQDPYSFRCIPQVHGATRDVIDYVETILTTEINSVTDNPTVFPDENLILSGGNFHGQPLALAADFLSIAIAELGSISERRVYRLISGERGLPAFLVANPGLNSGFMIPQYTAASIVSQNKQFCSPSSIDSISSSNEQEDHVSMGANASTKLLKVVNNVYKIVAIELLTSLQALQFRRPLKSSKKIERLFIEFRKQIPFVEDDVIMHDLLLKSNSFVKNYKI